MTEYNNRQMKKMRSNFAKQLVGTMGVPKRQDGNKLGLRKQLAAAGIAKRDQFIDAALDKLKDNQAKERGDARQDDAT